jgi:hypothetical protein
MLKIAARTSASGASSRRRQMIACPVSKLSDAPLAAVMADLDGRVN